MLIHTLNIIPTACS